MMLNDPNEVSKELQAALERDFPGSKLKHAPHSAPKTVSEDVEALRLAIDALTLKLGKLRDAL